MKQKITGALFWSFAESFSNQGITFLFGIILARLVSPHEFGLIGIISVIIAIAQSIIDSGFSQALIRKKDCTTADYATVFVYNLILAIIIYCILFFSSEAISVFFKENDLVLLIRIAGIGLLFNAFSLIQRTILIKQLNFRLQAKTALIASVLSGLIAIALALNGFGLWALLINIVLSYILNAVLICILGPWQTRFMFDRHVFRELFSFGSNLLLAGLLDTLYRNAYNLVIGKYFSAAALGFYTTAERFQSLPSQSLSGVIQRVSYPVLASMNDDTAKLKMAYKRLIGCTMLISFVLMFGMAALANNMLLLLVGERWLPSVMYLQLLCLVGVFYPLHALNLNILKVQGRSDLFLRLELIKKLLAVPIILLGIFYGIKMMIAGMIIASLISYYLNSFWSGKLINYPIQEQVKDIFPAFILSACMGAVVFGLGNWLNVGVLTGFMLQLLAGICITIGICTIFRIDDYRYMKAIIFDKTWRVNLYGKTK